MKLRMSITILWASATLLMSYGAAQNNTLAFEQEKKIYEEYCAGKSTAKIMTEVQISSSKEARDAFFNKILTDSRRGLCVGFGISESALETIITNGEKGLYVSNTPIEKFQNRTAARGDRGKTKELLQQGANINVNGETQKNILPYALEKQIYDEYCEMIDRRMEKFKKEPMNEEHRDSILNSLMRNVMHHVKRELCDKYNITDPVLDAIITKYKQINELNSQLIEAASNGDIERTKGLLKKGANANASYDNGYSALMKSAAFGKVETMKLLIQHGADVQSKEKNNGRTAIFYAAYAGHLDAVKLLVESGADLNIKGNDGVTALVIAAQEGHLTVVGYLLQNKADVNAKNHDGSTALSFAASKGHLEIVKLLLENKIDIETKTEEGQTPLMWAAYSGHAEVVRLLIKNGANVNAQRNDGGAALIGAANLGYLDVAKLLIQSGANINIKSKDGDTPLMFAAFGGYVEVAKLLIENGAEINAQRADGTTVLMAAAGKGHMSIVKLLIENKADVNAKDNEGATAWILCQRISPQNASEIIDVLSKAGALEPPIGIGDKVAVGNFIYTVNGIKFYKTVGNEFTRKRADGVFLVIDLSILNRDSQTRTLDASMFKMLDTSGTEYNYSIDGSTALELSGVSTLFLKQCQPKIPTRGKLIFEVPNPTPVYILKVSGGFWSGQSADIILR
ncbi:MAG: ankyrin repeat domain-containing protein [Candidatus Aureabacteria bacterium]|nr:ankyrin repeat domain-containing protein [Candidatus Auribacterota bacterium]